MPETGRQGLLTFFVHSHSRNRHNKKKKRTVIGKDCHPGIGSMACVSGDSSVAEQKPHQPRKFNFPKRDYGKKVKY